MEPKLTLVLGASPNKERYSNLAVRRLRAHGHPTIAVGRREGLIGDQPILLAIPEGVRPHTVTMYLNASNQQAWTDVLLRLSPERIIFNPGSENPPLAKASEAQGLEIVEGCTLVMLSTGQY